MKRKFSVPYEKKSIFRSPFGKGSGVVRTAFTLIELLVVIVIIGILATIGVASFNSYAVKARDAKRTAEFSQIGKHILTFTTANGRFPTISYEGGFPEPDCGNWHIISRDRQDIIEGLHLTDSSAKVECETGFDTVDPGTSFHIYSTDSITWCSDTSKTNGRFFVVRTMFENSDTRNKFSFKTPNVDGIGCEEGLYLYDGAPPQYPGSGVIRVFHEGNYQ